jgi:hypothetical protein
MSRMHGRKIWGVEVGIAAPSAIHHRWKVISTSGFSGRHLEFR